jgi:hypothetical protein
MSTTQIVKILTKWSVENEEYELLYNLYSMFNIGIPNIYIYKFPQASYFTSLSAVNDNLKTSDIHLQKLLNSFRKSKYKQLPAWDSAHGYSIF